VDLSTQRGPAAADLRADLHRSRVDGASPIGGPPPPVPFAGPRRRRSLASRRQKIVAAIVIVGALGFLLARGLANAMNYYLTANQAVAQRAQLRATDFRIQGQVLPGVHQVGTTLHFVITAHNVNVDVVSTGSPPQLFRVGMPVVLDGHWQGDVFSSFQIMVQHSSNYVEAPSGKAKSGTHST
jgi:cytochrome c-type biogenesis protein CcmE